MNNKKKYLMALIGISVLALAFILVQRVRVASAEAEIINQKVALSSSVVNNKAQLKQVVTIQQQVRKRQPLSDEQVAQLLAVVDGPPDSILKAKALATLSVEAPRGAFTPSQKAKIMASINRALKDPDWLTRLYAMSVLRAFADPATVASVRPLLNDPDANVRNAASRTIKEIEKSASKP